MEKLEQSILNNLDHAVETAVDKAIQKAVTEMYERNDRLT
jgi:hypothetical protein